MPADDATAALIVPYAKHGLQLQGLQALAIENILADKPTSGLSGQLAMRLLKAQRLQGMQL